MKNQSRVASLMQLKNIIYKILPIMFIGTIVLVLFSQNILFLFGGELLYERIGYLD